VTGVNGPNTFTDLSTHPFAKGRAPIVINHKGLESTASGRYQITLPTWKDIIRVGNWSDFSPLTQDEECLALLRRRNAVQLIVGNRIQDAITACHNEWESFPGTDFVQGKGPHSMSDMMVQYDKVKALY
jgi:muramidase (phage lysozyme)